MRCPFCRRLIDPIKSDAFAAWALEQAAEIVHVDVPVLRAHDRHQHIAHLRQTVMWLLRETGLSFNAIGRAIGRNHDVVLKACRLVDARHRADQWGLAEARRAFMKRIEETVD